MHLNGTSSTGSKFNSNGHCDLNSTIDKLDANNEASPVNQMFNGRSVFITGASGFIGRVLLEKLLRSYAGIKRIYILMRTKRNQHPSDRLHKQLLQVPIFDQIRSMENGKELLDKIVVIPGDIALPKLGISDEDMNTMVADETLSIIFHSAATIKFDEPIKQSVTLNMIATREIISLCRRLPNLVALCHVSTAYVNSDILDESSIEEQLYPIKDKPQDLIKLSEIMDDDLMQGLKVQLVGKRPNTYTYTKALAEHLIAKEAADLPVTIVRPSIVTGAWKEPLAGWVDNLNGPTGLILAVGKGLLRSLLAVRSVVADIIPVDVVVNTMIASTYYTARLHNKLGMPPVSDEILTMTKSIQTKDRVKKTVSIVEPAIKESDGMTDLDFSLETTKSSALNEQQQQQQNGRSTHNSANQCTTKNNKVQGDGEEDISSMKDSSSDRKLPHIIHCTSGDVKPLYWGNMEDMFNIVRKYPSAQVLRYPFGTFKTNKYHDLLARIFAHYLPALIIDMICGMLGKKRQLLSVYNKLHSATGALAHFCINNYRFKTGNIKQVEAILTDERDKQDLYMDISGIDWKQYFDDYVLGARRYVLKEPDENLPEARKSFLRAYYIEISLRVIMAALIFALLLPLIKPLASIYPIRGALQTLNLVV